MLRSSSPTCPLRWRTWNISLIRSGSLCGQDVSLVQLCKTNSHISSIRDICKSSLKVIAAIHNRILCLNWKKRIWYSLELFTGILTLLLGARNLLHLREDRFVHRISLGQWDVKANSGQPFNSQFELHHGLGVLWQRVGQCSSGGRTISWCPGLRTWGSRKLPNSHWTCGWARNKSLLFWASEIRGRLLPHQKGTHPE